MTSKYSELGLKIYCSSLDVPNTYSHCYFWLKHFPYSSEACRIQCIFDRQDRQEKYDLSTWKLLLKCSFPNYCGVFKGCHLTHCLYSICLNKDSEIDIEIFLVSVGLLTDYLPDYWLPFFILRRDFPLKSQTSSLVWGIEKWKWNRDAKKTKEFWSFCSRLSAIYHTQCVLHIA